MKPNKTRILWLIIYASGSLIATTLSSSAAPRLHGFDLSNLSIKRKEIKQGGPPRDGIPALFYPKFIPAAEARYLKNDDRVLGVEINGIAKAYPLRILDRHEVVNDRFSNQFVVVSYCPLCGSGMSFDASLDGRKTFGVSGLLYNSDVLLYDRETDSLWSQILEKSVSGPMVGKSLKSIVTLNTKWGSWKTSHPSTLVLSLETGHPSKYKERGYSGYNRQNGVMFPVKNRNKTYHTKARVLGLTINGQSKAYPFLELAFEGADVQDNVGGQTITVRYNVESETAQALNKSGSLIPATELYWFAWYAFHPDTEIFSSAKTPPNRRKRWQINVP
jgi:hypothetical protein